jgi:hypothetical protein
MGFRHISLGLLVLTSLFATAQTPTPVLVELFTSEGCSSCPPADSFLRALDEKQPISGVQLIVLGEHVDYWDGQGWRDIYSDHRFTARQETYATKMGTKGPYTPQMVVDGSVEFVGNDPQRASDAFQKTSSKPKTALQISSVTLENGKVHAHIESGAMPENAEVFVALALDHADSQVLHGENGGRHLEHVAVLRNLEKLGKVKQGSSFARDIQLKADANSRYRLIAFVQEPGQGRVLGAALTRVSEPTNRQ